jgi:hypothetical protein
MRRRKPPDTWCQVNLRIRESLRAELAAAAEEHEVSFNQEVRARLADSLEEKARQSLENLAADLERKARDIELAWRRFDAYVQRLGTTPETPLGSPHTITHTPPQQHKKSGDKS